MAGRQSVMLDPEQRNNLVEFIKSADEDGDGQLSVRDLEYALHLVGVDMPANKIQDMIQELDTDQNGKLSLEEFEKVWSRAYNDNLDDYNMNNSSGNYRHRDAFKNEVKDSNEARRWMKQAKEDFQAASFYLRESAYLKAKGDKVTFNWICYIFHQASEKSLKAACYAKNANCVSLSHHSLTQPATLLTPSLVKLAQRMENHLGQHTSMRYPNAVDQPQIPAEIFTMDHAETAMSIAKEIIGGSSLLIE